MHKQRWACCAEECKSASPHVIFVALQRKLRFSKAQLRSLSFKLLDTTFNRNFYDFIRYQTMVHWALIV
jgi:hypothetical protein